MGFGTDESVLFIEVSSIQRCLDREMYNMLQVYMQMLRLHLISYCQGEILTEERLYYLAGHWVEL